MSDTPRTDAVMNGEHAKFRLLGLTMVLERELAIQTNLMNHFKAEAARFQAMLGDKATTLDPVD